MTISERGIPGTVDYQLSRNKSLHEEDGPVTSISVSRDAEVGPVFKSTADHLQRSNM